MRRRASQTSTPTELRIVVPHPQQPHRATTQDTLYYCFAVRAYGEYELLEWHIIRVMRAAPLHVMFYSNVRRR